jgi:hypothetical protein
MSASWSDYDRDIGGGNEKQQIEYVIVAQSFIKNYQGFWRYDRHYSCKITKYSDSSVLIKKTKEKFEHTANEYNEYESELGCIKTFIKNL